MLNFPTDWRFEAPGEGLPAPVIWKMSELISRVASQGDRWSVVEHFKIYFAAAAGLPYHRSSSPSWADSDLEDHMRSAASNPALFIEAFYDACQALKHEHPEFGIPDVSRMNRVLSENSVIFEIRPPDLVFTGTALEPVAVPATAPTLDVQAQELINRSLKEADQLLREGRHRQAVAEIFWLLETVTTAFRGLTTENGTVQEKYFTTIAKELRRHHRGQMLDQVLTWVTALHGYLSSPTGGGVRHGTDIRNAVEIPAGDAQLYCNLGRSYIGYLMAEHERLSRSSNPFL